MERGLDYIGVGALILVRDGNVFLAKRGRNSLNEAGNWEFPGGGVEFGGRLRYALVREIRDEFCFEISVGLLLDVVDHILPGEKLHWVSPAFLFRYASGEPRILEPWKRDEIGWCPVDAIPSGVLFSASRDSLSRLLLFHAVGKDGPA